MQTVRTGLAHRPRGFAAILLLLTAALLVLASCSSGGDKKATSTTSAPALPSASAAASSVPSASASAAASASTQPSPTALPPASPTVPPTPTPGAALAAAYAAILRDTGARSADQCPTDPGSQPDAKPCVLTSPGADSPERGIAVFGVRAFPGGYTAVYGRDGSGAWRFWYGTQQDTYHALQLPGEMRVCADGQGATVRLQPDLTSASQGVIKDGTTVTADQFVLTQAGTISGPGPLGNGWYQVSAPTKGFIRADLISTTRLPDCSLRDFLTKSAAGR